MNQISIKKYISEKTGGERERREGKGMEDKGKEKAQVTIGISEDVYF